MGTRIHRVEKAKSVKGIVVLSPLGKKTEIETKDFSSPTIIRALHDVAPDIEPGDEFAMAIGGAAPIPFAICNNDGTVVSLHEHNSRVEVVPLSPYSPEELAQRAKNAIARKATQQPTKKKTPLSQEFKSFLARIKYMIYMDHPTGSAPAIDATQLAWEVYHIPASKGVVFKAGRNHQSIILKQTGPDDYVKEVTVIPEEITKGFAEMGW